MQIIVLNVQRIFRTVPSWQPRENPLLVLLESESPLLTYESNVDREAQNIPHAFASGGSSSGVLFAGSGDLSMHACIVCLCGCILRCSKSVLNSGTPRWSVSVRVLYIHMYQYIVDNDTPCGTFLFVSVAWSVDRICFLRYPANQILHDISEYLGVGTSTDQIRPIHTSGVG